MVEWWLASVNMREWPPAAFPQPIAIGVNARQCRFAEQHLKAGKDDPTRSTETRARMRLPSLTLDRPAAAMDRERRWRYLYPGRPVPRCTTLGGLHGLSSPEGLSSFSAYTSYTEMRHDL